MSNQVQFSFSIEETDHEFRVESFEVEERLFQPFEVKVSLLSRDADIALDELVRKAGVLKLFGQGSDVSRYFHGIVKEVSFKGSGRQFSRYELVLVPDLWFLTQREDCRIFQDLTINEIIESVLEEANVTAFRMLADAGEKQEYILQYRETDLEFIHRLMAQHGLWYFFDHSETGHELVIVDKNELISELVSTPENATLVPDASEHAILYHGDAGGVPDREHIFDADFATRVHTGAVSQTDYNYLTPKTRLMADVPESDEAEAYTDLAVYRYPGRYQQQPHGKQQADYRLSAHKVSGTELNAVGCVMRFIPGYSFVMESHPRQSLNRDFILLQVKHYGRDPQVHAEERSGEPTTYHNEFIAFPADMTYRAPAQKAPVVEGPQTAVVVGPANEEIYTDNLGRVKVQFHWDRLGGMDEHSTCWVRVSQTLAGPNWGSVFLPRIGHEVVVTFLEGDPDQPLVTGSVYHGLHRPPYDLPLKKTRTTIRSKTHKGEGYNEISLDDETNQEELYLRAQKDMSVKVLNDRFEQIGNDDTLTVARHKTNEIGQNQLETIKGNKTTEVKGTFTETVDGDVTVNYNSNEAVTVVKNSDLKINQNRTTEIGKNDELEVMENQTITIHGARQTQVDKDNNLNVEGNSTLTVTGNVTSDSKSTTQIISKEKIVLKAGSSQIVLNSDGSIQITGTSISINGSDKVVVQGGKVSVN
ncbi:type VI secretion system Vgr family protein [Photobacterium sp. 1_MG-2023]|uniref:type VI secretion system Vgr family protein n=1 Tax=Photobacterium sp. 1_MG-2023 TaxID=3062646 RepID=UPI0026E16F23|nr:type VI secretion system tip protein TssI/VgrG [Photobacterium sp. 1_MG-2023]MDO6706069.1 type VI secretion system tip protein TssI/VgrG [Photobacterium sp. 1_MG-2023]